MPKFNGTGPKGYGAMTGRGRGYCITPVYEGASNNQWASEKATFGGRNLRRGRLHNWSSQDPDSCYKNLDLIDPHQKISHLQERVNSLENALQQTNSKINDLEKKQ